jgi:hypothetical protein
MITERYGFMRRSEGPVGPDTVESVRDVTAERYEDHDASEQAKIPSGGVATSLFVAATVVALGIAAVDLFVLALGIIDRSCGHRGHGDECRWRLAHIKCGQIFNGLRIV